MSGKNNDRVVGAQFPNWTLTVSFITRRETKRVELCNVHVESNQGRSLVFGLAVRPMLTAKLSLFLPIKKIEADNW